MMSLSRQASDKIRGRSASFLAPFAEKILSFKAFLKHPLQPSPREVLSPEEEKERLQMENQLLKLERASLQKIISEQGALFSQLSSLSPVSLSSDSPHEGAWLASDSQKALERLITRFKWHLQATPARVIFRSFDLSNPTLWINIGEATNREHDSCLIGKNSPVLLGDAIVGWVEEVGEHHSRVCLITDNRLSLSVRAARGGEQEWLLAEQLDSVLREMNVSKGGGLGLSPEEQKQLSTLLKKWKQQLQPFKKSWYLAKGELRGCSPLSRRGEEPLLQGTGFNYDFADEEGEGRDLRTGRPLKNTQGGAIPLLKTGDLLVTTGLDGLFPPGFPVAYVTKVQTLKEGDYFYHLEARPVAGSLEELSLLFVLPPLEI